MCCQPNVFGLNDVVYGFEIMLFVFLHQDSVIQEDDEIRVKLVGIRVDASDIFAIGTLMDDYLGKIITITSLMIHLLFCSTTNT